MSSNTIYNHHHFIDNKYNTLYFKIINNAKQRSEVSGYTEKHHIIPRSMGGSDLPENLVILTAREHFICHYILLKFTISDGKKSMFHAFSMMLPNNVHKTRYVNARLYASIKEEYSKIVSESKKGRKRKPHTEETKDILSKKLKGRKISDYQKLKVSSARKGKKHSEEAKIKMCKPRSEETKTKMRKPKSDAHRMNMSGKTFFTNSITGIIKKFNLNNISINELIAQEWIKGRFKITSNFS